MLERDESLKKLELSWCLCDGRTVVRWPKRAGKSLMLAVETGNGRTGV